MIRTIILCFCLLSAAAYAMPQDSIGTKMVDGKSYLLHKVSKGEGVFSIARKYGVTAAEIYAANPGSEQSIRIDQVLLIPRKWNTYASASNRNSGGVTEKTYHTVAKGQTLSSIAKSYGISVDKLKTMNGLSSDNIRLGQKLVVKEASSGSYAAVEQKPAAPAPQPQRQPETPKPEPVQEEQKNVVVNPVSPLADNASEEKPGAVNTSYSTDDGDEIAENGTAMVSAEGDLSQDRSFILHPSAKIGTIVMITNAANNNTVFARVVGNCKAENGVILKMSKTVAAKLGASGNTEVKVSYAK